MIRSAALLIDVESFWLGREARHRAANGAFDFDQELAHLVTAAEAAAGGARLAVRRGYADFQAARRLPNEERPEHFLRACPTALLEHGILPVQVFRVPHGSRRAAIEVRIASDALDLATGAAPVSRFVLVSGTTDIVLHAVELRARGAEVVVLGADPEMDAVCERFCDEYRPFDEALAAAAADRGPLSLESIGAVLRQLVHERGPLVLAAVHPMLAQRLGRPFDPAHYGCESTGEFVRRFARDLGVEVRRGAHDAVVGLPSEISVELPRRAREARHTPQEYRYLLRLRNPRIHLVPYDDWLRITEMFFVRAYADGDRPIVHQHDLSEEVTEQCRADGMPFADKKVQATAFQLFKSGCFVCAEPDAEGATDFHWSKAARLAPSVQDVDTLRDLARTYVARILVERLQSEFGTSEVDAETFAEVLEGPDVDDERIDALEGVLDRAGATS